MSAAWWDLPGPDRFIDWLFEDLSEGKSVVGSLPVTAPTGLREIASRRASEEGFCWREILHRDSALAREISPIETLCCELAALGSDEPPSVRSWLRAPHPVGLVVWVECLDSEQAATWLKLVSEYAAEAGSAGADPPRLCILCSGLSDRDLPRSEVLLGVRRYTAAVSPLDTLLLTSRLLESSDQHSPTLRALRSAIAAEVAGTDPTLAYRLAAESFDRLLEPKQLLLDRATELGWVKSLGNTAEQPTDHLESWHGRSRLHSSAVALAADDRELRRRIWRAQVQVLFPVLEELRVHLVEDLRGRIQLPVLFDGREITDLQELELAQLRDQARRNGVPRRLQDTLDTAAFIRNQIAHLEVVREGTLRRVGIA